MVLADIWQGMQINADKDLCAKMTNSTAGWSEIFTSQTESEKTKMRALSKLFHQNAKAVSAGTPTSKQKSIYLTTLWGEHNQQHLDFMDKTIIEVSVPQNYPENSVTVTKHVLDFSFNGWV